MVPALAGAATIELRDARLYAEDGAHRLDSDFAITLPQEVEELVARGIEVQFTLDFQLVRERRYWFNRSVVERRQQLRLSYHAITRSYRVSSGLLHQSFDSLDAALRRIGRVRGWEVAAAGELRPDKNYRVSLRLALDRTALPRPFQLQVLASDAWKLDSGIRHWVYLPGATP
jgi:hypothetical protein